LNFPPQFHSNKGNYELLMGIYSFTL